MVDCGEKRRCNLRFVSIKVHCTRSIRRLVLAEKSAAAGDDQTVSACQCVIPRGICLAVTAVCCNAVECRHRKGVVHLIRRHEHGQSTCFVNRVNRLLGCKRLHRIVPRPLNLEQRRAGDVNADAEREKILFPPAAKNETHNTLSVVVGTDANGNALVSDRGDSSKANVALGRQAEVGTVMLTKKDDAGNAAYSEIKTSEGDMGGYQESAREILEHMDELNDFIAKIGKATNMVMTGGQNIPRVK